MCRGVICVIVFLVFLKHICWHLHLHEFTVLEKKSVNGKEPGLLCHYRYILPIYRYIQMYTSQGRHTEISEIRREYDDRNNILEKAIKKGETWASRLILLSIFSGKSQSNTQHQLSTFMSPLLLYSHIPWHLISTLSQETNSISLDLGWKGQHGNGGERSKFYFSRFSVSAPSILLRCTSQEYFDIPLLKKQRAVFLMSASSECWFFTLYHLNSLVTVSLSFLHVLVILFSFFFCVNFPFLFPQQVWSGVGIHLLYK